MEPGAVTDVLAGALGLLGLLRAPIANRRPGAAPAGPAPGALDRGRFQELERAGHRGHGSRQAVSLGRVTSATLVGLSTTERCAREA